MTAIDRTAYLSETPKITMDRGRSGSLECSVTDDVAEDTAAVAFDCVNFCPFANNGRLI